MFRGTSVVKSDPKGRVVIPSRFRESLDGKGFVLTGHPGGFLLLVPTPGYEEIEAKVRGMPDRGKDALYFKQVLIGMADDSQRFDSAGRVMIGQELRSHAGINGEVSVVGMGDHIRLWSKRKLDALYSSIRKEKKGSMDVPDGWGDFSV